MASEKKAPDMLSPMGLTINPADIGPLVLKTIWPINKRVDDKYTDEIIGYKYSVACADHHYKWLPVNIYTKDVMADIEACKNKVVVFGGLKIMVRENNGVYSLYATALSITVVG